MPRPPAFKSSAVRDLAYQLRYAPEATRRRILTAAEKLAGEIERDRVYPEEFIVFRITGYRKETGDESMMLVGEALLADLATFVQLMSRELNLPAVSRRRGEAHAIDDFAQRLCVSSRTLRRYHKRGLLFHYVQFGDEKRLACYESSLAQFERRDSGMIARATHFSRVDRDLEVVLVAEAVRMRHERGFSRQRIARELAQRHRRAVETIRSILARHERELGLVTGRRHRTRERERGIVRRAWQRCVPVRDIARRLGRTQQTIRRIVNDHRSRRIRAIRLKYVNLPTFALPAADEVILSAPGVHDGLYPASSEHDAVALLGELRCDVRPDPAVTEARVAAFNFLKYRVEVRAELLPARPSDADLDRIETDLRWIALLKRTLAYHTLPQALVQIDQHFEWPLHQQSAEIIRSMLGIAVAKVGDAIEQVDLNRDQQLDRLALHGLERTLAQHDIGRQAGRAAARHEPGAIALGDPFDSLCEWQSWCELPAASRRQVDALPPRWCRTLALRFGLDHSHPRSIAEIAAELESTPRSVARDLHEALRSLRTGVR